MHNLIEELSNRAQVLLSVLQSFLKTKTPRRNTDILVTEDAFDSEDEDMTISEALNIEKIEAALKKYSAYVIYPCT